MLAAVNMHTREFFQVEFLNKEAYRWNPDMRDKIIELIWYHRKTARARSAGAHWAFIVYVLLSSVTILS